jgi:hypothetical protein
LSSAPNTTTLDWKAVVSSFQVACARDLLAMTSLERYQDVRATLGWLDVSTRPLALLFISHRWETLEHPDPTGRQLRAVQVLLGRVCQLMEAMLVPREERLRLVPSLEREGTLQAHELARRILGFGPFSDSPVCIPGAEARRMIVDRFRLGRDDRHAFRQWLTSLLGVWLDYSCMPQKPLLPEEVSEHQRALRALGSLVKSSTVIALRQPDDDYSLRGWCASEFFLGSGRSFSRGIFVDIDRLERQEDLWVPHPPSLGGGAAAAKIVRETYDQDLAAFRSACEAWADFEGPLVGHLPEDIWGCYRSLQGSGFLGAALDPNPFRRAMDALGIIETALTRDWLMSGQTVSLDLGEELGRALEGAGLRCAEPNDLAYLGFLLACEGLVDVYRPLFRACLERHVARGARSLVVTLHPLDEAVRSLFSAVTPASPDTWRSRLSSRFALSAEEGAVIAKVRASLEANPPAFTLDAVEMPVPPTRSPTA